MKTSGTIIPAPKYLEENHIDNLFIDANAMIHPCAREALSGLDRIGEYTEEEIWASISQQFLNYLDMVILLVAPKNLLYIAVDGVAPRAKMDQQRQRRYKSAKTSKMSNQIYETLLGGSTAMSEKSSFDTNSISPGTRFMNFLTVRIEDHYSAKKKSGHVSTVLSSAKCPGEGEHKILGQMRKAGKGSTPISKDHVNVIYGLDADLIFLGLSLGISGDTPSKILLLREHLEFSNEPTSPEADVQAFDFLDISALSEAIYQDTISRTRCIFEKHKIVRDYIFICFLLGNDFLPHIPSLSIRAGGHDRLLKTYLSILRNSDKHLVLANNDINPDFFGKLITSLAASEDEVLKEEHMSRLRYKVRPFVIDPHMTEIENNHARLMHNFENLQDLRHNENLVRYGTRGWKWRYWDLYFHVNHDRRAREYDRIRKTATHLYLTGLRWTWSYYVGDNTNWTWYYPYEMGPTLTDIREFFDTDVMNTRLEKTKPVKSFEQLLMILPSSSSELLPVSYRQLTVPQVPIPKDSIAHYYPIDFQVISEYKNYYGETIPLLPVIDQRAIEAAVKGLKLTVSERKLNSSDRDKILC